MLFYLIERFNTFHHVKTKQRIREKALTSIQKIRNIRRSGSPQIHMTVHDIVTLKINFNDEIYQLNRHN